MPAVRPLSRTRVVWTLVAVCALGAALRFWGIGYGLPGLYHPDETPILNRALALAKGDPNPHNFLYPSVYFYTQFLWQGLFFVAGRAAGLFTSLAQFQQQFFVDPSAHFIAARALSAVLGTATLLIAYRLGRTLHGVAAGLAAALFLAVSPFSVRDAHYVKLDVPVAFMTALAHLWLVWLALDAPAAARKRSWAVAGALGGLAFSTQYYVAPLVAAYAALAGLDGWRTGQWRTAATRLTAAGAGFLGGFLAGTPFIVVDLPIAIHDMTEVRSINFDRAVDTGGPLTSLWPYLEMLATDAMGWPVFLLALVGSASVLRRDAARGLALVTFPVAYLLFIAHTVPMSRYLDCVLPLVAVAAGIGAVVLAGRLAPGSATSRASTAAVVAVLAAVPGFLLSVRSNGFFTQADTRAQAKQFVEQHVEEGATILIQPQSAPLHMSREALGDALRLHLGDESRASVKFQYQMAATPYPSPSYRLIYLGDGGEDVDRTYISARALKDAPTLAPLRNEGVEYVVLKRTNIPNPSFTALEAALAREATRIATFSPYRPDTPPEVQAATSPYFHNTATRIVAALERPGPTVDIWKLP